MKISIEFKLSKNIFTLPHTKHRQFHKLSFPRRLLSKNIFKIFKPGTKTFGWIPAAIKSLADGLGSQHGASRDNNIWSYFWWYSGLSFLTVKTIYKLKKFLLKLFQESFRIYLERENYFCDLVSAKICTISSYFQDQLTPLYQHQHQSKDRVENEVKF